MSEVVRGFQTVDGLAFYDYEYLTNKPDLGSFLTYKLQSLTEEQRKQVYENLGLKDLANSDINKTEIIESVIAAISPESIGAVNKHGDQILGDLHSHATLYLDYNNGGSGKTLGHDTSPITPKLRNSSLNSSDTIPTENGTICWTYK